LLIPWGGFLTDYFPAVNGVKRGAALTPVLLCVYLDNLLIALSKAGVGCFVGPTFVGTLAYADDIVLIAPTATAMRKLLALCDSYACDYCISFNAHKTKCMIVTPNKRSSFSSRLDSCGFQIHNKPIEFVSSFSHVGLSVI
jgi:Reverse transcriptase (RNA-dependent DNA polymerase)